MKRTLSFALAVGLTVGALAGTAEGMSRPERRLLRFTNHARVARDHVRLGSGWRLNRFAARAAERLARQERLVHSTDVPCVYWGENIGVTDGGMWWLHRAFMESPAHRANVVNGAFRRVGIGVVREGDVKWVALVFCA